jgi:hypothetical protein
MAEINLNPISVPALASYAGNTIGNLGLDIKAPMYDSGFRQGLSALGAGIQAGKDRAAVQEQSTAKLQFAASEAEKTREAESIEAEKARAELRPMREQQMRMQQHIIDQQKAEFDMKIQEKAAEKAEQHTAQELAKKSAAAQMYLLSPKLQQSEDLTRKYVDNLVKQGVYTPEEAKEFMAASPEERKIMVKTDLVSSGFALKSKTSSSKTGGANDPLTNALTDAEEKTSEPLTAPAKTAAQKQVMASQKVEAGMAKIEKLYNPRFLQWRGKYGKDLMNYAEKAEGIPIIGDALRSSAEFISGVPKEQQEKFIYEMTYFQNQVEQIFQEYRKAVTGTQASDREIQMLRKIFLNPDMGPTEFKAAMHVLADAAKEGRELSMDQLKEGIALTVGEKKFGKPEDRKRLTDINPKYTDENIAATAKKHGISEAEVISKLTARHQKQLEAQQEKTRTEQ